MQTLNLPYFEFRIKDENGKKFIFDRWRKKYVSLTPEEWVRQNFIMYLIHEKKFPASLIAIEKSLNIGKRIKRTDIVVYNNLAEPLLIVECKAPEVKINQDVFDQIIRYNMTLNVKYLVVTNGLQHYCSKLDYLLNSCDFLKEIPDYKDLLSS